MAATAGAEEYYSGAVNSNGTPHGIGERRDASGNVYVGNFVNGKRDGKGVMKYPDGAVYDGEWKDGQQHGEGKYTWSNGHIYVGEFRNGNLNGRGVYTYTDGAVYDGEWKDGRMHGKGKHTWSNGDMYVGEWENDRRNGDVTLTMANGESFKQVYVKGIRTSNKLCVSDVTRIHDLFPSPRSCADGTFDIIMLNEYDKECQVCTNKYLPDVDAKKPVVGSCNHVFCHECVLQTARSRTSNGGTVPTRIDCMQCKAKDAFCPSAPLYEFRLIDWLKRSIPILRKTDPCV
jgi:hypothetical protein